MSLTDDKALRELAAALAEDPADAAAVLVDDLNAVVRYGTVRPGYGLEVTVTGRLRGSAPAAWSRGGGSGRVAGSLDVHGPALFSAFPHGLGSAAEMLLPLGLRLTPSKRSKGHRSDEAIFTLVLGAKRLGAARIDSTLEGLVAAGDPPFAFELRASGGVGRVNGGDELIGYLPTSASLIQAGLAASSTPGSQPKPIRLEGPLPLAMLRRSRARLVLGWARWWLCPLLFTAGCWAAFWRPAEVLETAPTILGAAAVAMSPREVLPPHPTSMSEAFRLGGLRAQLAQLVAGAQTVPDTSGGTAAAANGTAAVLREAARIVSRPVTEQQLLGMLATVETLEADEGLIAKVTGLFTFINTMWAFAIIGITVSIGPAVYHLLEPIRHLLRRLITWVVDNVVVPTMTRLHRWGVLEAIAFALCWLLVVDGLRAGPILEQTPTNSDAARGTLVAATGAALAAPAFGYSTLLRGRRVGHRALRHLVQFWLAASWAPVAAVLGSRLLGWMTVVATFGSVGFGVWAGPLCLAIGFDTKDSLKRCFVAALSLVAGFVAVRASSHRPDFLAPFVQPASVMGPVVLFLTTLIMSSEHYDHDEPAGARRMWWVCNGAMALLLVCAQLLGHTISGMAGMAHVGTTFTVLFALDKYAEFHLSRRWNGWCLMLLVSVATWWCSLFLHANPQFVAALFDAV